MISKTQAKTAETGEALIVLRNVQSLQTLTITLKTAASHVRVTDDDECKSARMLLTKIISAKERVMVFIGPILENAKQGLKLARQQEATLVNPILELERDVRFHINTYLTEVARKKRWQDEEQARLKREHEEKVARSKRPERIKALEILEPEEIITPPCLENTSVPMVPKYEVVDERLITSEYTKTIVDTGKIWEAVRTAHRVGPDAFSNLKIPGVRIWEEAQIGVRR